MFRALKERHARKKSGPAAKCIFCLARIGKQSPVSIHIYARPRPGPMAGVHFVLQTDGTKVDDPNARKSIRRHVMLGKNKGKRRVPRQPTLTGCDVFAAGTPCRVGSDLSCVEFADAVELSVMHDTLRFCTATSEHLFVLAPCVAFNAKQMADTCLQALSCDPLHLNVMVFGAQAYIHEIARQNNAQMLAACRPNAYFKHYGKALHLLRVSLADTEARSEVSDTTVMSVIALAMHALANGEAGSARHHAMGLSRLVHMRETGVYSFGGKMSFMIEIVRCDVAISLATGQKPLLFSDFYEPLVPLPELPKQKSKARFVIDNEDLAQIWDVLRRFCVMINEAAAAGTKVADSLLLNITASVMYRLLDQSFASGSTDEVVRLAMLAFCANALLGWRQIRMPFDWLQRELKRLVDDAVHTQPRSVDAALLLWLLATYGVAFMPLSQHENDSVERRMGEMARVCGLTTWESMKSVVSDFLWIDIVCDRPARTLFGKTVAAKPAMGELTEPPLA